MGLGIAISILTMKTTYFENITAGLKLMGCVEVPTRSGKYKAFKYAAFKSGQCFFVGPKGALRKGPTSSCSVSIGDPTNQTPFYQRLLQAHKEGHFRACMACVHYQHTRPTGTNVTAAEAERYPAWCSKLTVPTGDLRLRCGGDDFELRHNPDPSCPLCQGSGMTTAQGTACACTRNQ